MTEELEARPTEAAKQDLVTRRNGGGHGRRDRRKRGKLDLTFCAHATKFRKF